MMSDLEVEIEGITTIKEEVVGEEFKCIIEPQWNASNVTSLDIFNMNVLI